MSKPLVSVLIPAHNASSTLERAVSSALAQDYPCKEIVIVDDASTDATPEIAQRLARQHQEVRVVSHGTNRQLLETRRTAVLEARGQYVLFLDSDDELLPSAIASSVEVAELDDCDIVQFGTEPHYDSEPSPGLRDIYERYFTLPRRSLTGKELVRAVFITREVPWTAWGKLYRTELLRETFSRIPTTRLFLAEDACISFISSTLSSKYETLPDLKGIRYYMDTGMSGATKLAYTLDEFRESCTALGACDVIRRYLIESGQEAKYEEGCEALFHSLLLDLASRAISQVPEPQRDEAISVLAKTTSPERLAGVIRELGADKLADRVGALQRPDVDASGDAIPMSIVIAAYNEERLLERAVASCLLQTLPNAQIVIVDDCSTDDTGRLADTLARQHPATIVVIHNEKNEQLLESRRIGLGLAKGEYVTFLDADDELDAAFCERALRLALSSKADIIVSPIVPVYERGREPDSRTVEGRAQMYASPDLSATDDDIVHATYRDSRVVWSLVGKTYRRETLRAAFTRIPHQRVFQAEDAYAYFAISTTASSLVSRSDLPAYRYHMGVGGTAADRVVDAESFASVCRNSLVAEKVKSLITEMGAWGTLGDDFCHLRHNLLADPANRFPDTVRSEDRAKAFDAFVREWSAVDAIAALADRHWDDAPAICRSVSNAQSLRIRNEGMDTIAVYCPGDDELVENDIETLVGIWRSLGKRVVLICDNTPNLPPLCGANERLTISSCSQSQEGVYAARGKELQSSLARTRADVLVYCQPLAPALPWDLLIARSLGIPVILYARERYASIISRGARVALALPTIVQLASVVVCKREEDTAFWKRFNPDVLLEPKLSPASSVKPQAEALRTVVWSDEDPTFATLEEAIVAFAWSKAASSGFGLVLAFRQDSDALATQARELARAHGISDSVDIREVPTRNLRSIYASAWAILSTSRASGPRFGFPNELGIQTACVAYRPAGALDNTAEGVVLVQPGDVDLLARTLAIILTEEPTKNKASSGEARTKQHASVFDHGIFWNKALTITSHHRNPITGGTDLAQWDELAQVISDKQRQIDRLLSSVASITEEIRSLRNAAEQESLAHTNDVTRLEAVISDLQAGLQHEREQHAMTADVLNRTAGSVSFKVGRALTKPLRTIRDALHKDG